MKSQSTTNKQLATNLSSQLDVRSIHVTEEPAQVVEYPPSASSLSTRAPRLPSHFSGREWQQKLLSYRLSKGRLLPPLVLFSTLKKSHRMDSQVHATDHPPAEKPLSTPVLKKLPASARSITANHPSQDSLPSIELVDDSSSDLSPARSDVSDVSDWEVEDVTPSSDTDAAPRQASVQERSVNILSVDNSLSSGTSHNAKKKDTKTSKISQYRVPPKWLGSRLNRIPVPYSIQTSQEDGILIHLTFQRDLGGNLFYPPDASLGDSERFILSQSSSAFKDRRKHSGRLVRSESVTGFSATLPQSTTETTFERHVQQLLRAYFLHPAPEQLRVQVEFHTVQWDKEGKPQIFDGLHTSLLDFFKDQDKHTQALSAVVTRIALNAEIRHQNINDSPAFDYAWTHWVRVGNTNEFVDRFPASIPLRIQSTSHGDLPLPHRKDRAVLFGVGIR